MEESKSNDLTKPEIALFVLIIIVILLLIFSDGSPEKERELKDKLQEKKKALHVVLENIKESQIFRDKLLKDIKLTTIVLRWVVFGKLILINIIMFLSLGYNFEFKQILECIAIVNPSAFMIVYVILFLRYGEFAEIKNVYHGLQIYILKLRYDITQEQIEAYLNLQMISKDDLSKEINDIELRLQQIEYSKVIRD